jgi:hypothetical protein
MVRLERWADEGAACVCEHNRRAVWSRCEEAVSARVRPLPPARPGPRAAGAKLSSGGRALCLAGPPRVRKRGGAAGATMLLSLARARARARVSLAARAQRCRPSA